NGLRKIRAEDAQVRRILRQRDTRANAHFEHTAADLVGSQNGRAPALAENTAEDEIVDRGPAVVGLLDRFTVEVELPCTVKLDDFCHDRFCLVVSKVGLTLDGALAGHAGDGPQRTARLQCRQIADELSRTVFPGTLEREIPARL